jgi:hypothetical protein
MVDSRAIASISSIATDIWSGFRPYLIRLFIDFMVSGSLWVFLYLFKWLTRLLEIDGPAGRFILNLHAAGAVSAFGIFAVLFAVDLYELHSRKVSHGHRRK